MNDVNIRQSSDFIIKELRIRQANESDTDALAALIAELGYPTETSAIRARLADLYNYGDCILVAIDNSKVIGMILLHRTRFLHRPPDGRISTLVVFASYRGLGIGARLIAEAEDIFRNWGCSRIEVSSGASRTAAHRFYLREGYIKQPERFIKLLSPPAL